MSIDQIPEVMLAQMPSALWVTQHLIQMVFVFCFGACVGSFVNVLNFRLPAGMSVINPPSRCPTCGARLKFFRENLPIIGWFCIRGKCRYCGVRVSPQYMVVELMMALVFVGLYAVLYTTGSSMPWLGQVSNVFWWSRNGFMETWPAFFAIAFLFAGLISMTIIDARTFMIPIQIPVFVTIAAFIAYAAQYPMYPMGVPPWNAMWHSWAIPGLHWTGSLMAIGGMIGVVLAIALLRLGVFRMSFADYNEYVKEDEVLGDYPHARREMRVELAFLSPIILGIVLGGVAARWMPAEPPPFWLQSITASFAGYLVGGGVIWAIRILGTLGFGREAMGLGDVHLLGAVGAVLGWADPIAIFFIAPFSGLLWAMVSMGLGSIFKKLRRELPYGPHLALATVLVFFGRPLLIQLWNVIAPVWAWPSPGFVH